MILKRNDERGGIDCMIKIIKDKDQWSKVLQLCDNRDSYHTFEYHQLSKNPDETPYLFVYQQGKIIIALPLLLREIEGTNYKDATSVYGYAGPAYTCKDPDRKLLAGFRTDIKKLLLENNIISVFSRLHPFLPEQLQLLENLGSLEQVGQVVYVDLQTSPKEQLDKYNNRLKTHINKARRECNIYKISSTSEVHEFKELYYQNMDRVNADSSYYFPDKYFQSLKDALQFKADYYLIEERANSRVIGGGILLRHGQMAQYHLSGTRDNFQHLSPTKLLIDQMRIDAFEAGAQYFNLGGGIGGSNDNLFRFKKLFSSDYKPFYLWKYIVNPKAYDELSQRKDLTKNKKFFPAYRL